MVQERLSILTMLEKGKISVEEATALLDVMEQPDKPDPRPLEETLRDGIGNHFSRTFQAPCQ